MLCHTVTYIIALRSLPPLADEVMPFMEGGSLKGRISQALMPDTEGLPGAAAVNTVLKGQLEQKCLPY